MFIDQYMQTMEAVEKIKRSCMYNICFLYTYLPNYITYSIFCSYHPTDCHILHISIHYKYPSQVGPSPLSLERHSWIYSVLDRVSRTGWRVGDHNVSLPHHCGAFPSDWL